MKKIYAIGEALIDFKYENNSFIQNAGGAPANVCAAISKLGGYASIITKLSNDIFSTFLLDAFKKYNIDTTNIIIDPKEKTGLAFIKDGKYSFYFNDSSSVKLNKKEINKKLFDKDSIIHICSLCLGNFPIKDAIKYALDNTKGLVSFDLNLRENIWDDKALMIDRCKEFIVYADILKLSIEELKTITNCNNEIEGIKCLKELSNKWKIVIITLGSNGVTAYNRDLEYTHINALKVKEIDTTGAGDTFIGAFLYYISIFNKSLDLANLQSALEFSNRASAYKVSHKGTMEGMPSYYDMFHQPIFFNRNRVYRIYLGGKGYHKLLGDSNTNNFFPEEWLCSKVKAINPKYFGIRDGVSVIEGTNIFLDDLLKNEPRIEGNKKYDCLVKYLDSAIRLPMQVHPTKEFSKKYFNSEYGKTEAWLVIDARKDAKLYFGFKNKITKQELFDLEIKSNTERDIMRSILNEVKPKVGDIYLIKGGLIHAIGENCTIIEIQEPTDFTIQPEGYCGDYKISEEEKYIGLTKDVALDCFNYDLVGSKALDMAKISPKIEYSSDYLKENLITYKDTPCFKMNRYTLDKKPLNLCGGPSVWIVLDGSGVLYGKDYKREIKKGDYFLLPNDLDNLFKIKGNIKLIECIGSDNNE
ncbi:MAG: hypothetical protein K6E24_00510 [bacterium]|nr:hypothetical protein [bacterium]